MLIRILRYSDERKNYESYKLRTVKKVPPVTKVSLKSRIFHLC